MEEPVFIGRATLIKDFLILLLHSIMIPFFNSQYLFPKFQTPKAAMIINALYLENSASLERMAKDKERCRLLLTYDVKNNAWDLILCQIT